MTVAADPLTTLIESLADGDEIDWDAIDALAGDSELRGLVDHLRLVAGVAEIHRSQLDESDGEPAKAFEAPAQVADDRERWGHLALVRRLGQGAFGEVYLAHDTWLDHPRALKLLKPEVAQRISHEQLLNEARKLVRVRHPGVVAVHGADRHDGRVGFWMDFVDGRTLADLVADEHFDADQASRIGRELCDALSAVHHANLIHRDIKAQNVMRTGDGRIFLMDFGAGEFMGTSPGGRPQGTPLYLAPELFDGGAASVQSDIYAVGVLLYHLVTGSFPVKAVSVTELINAHAVGSGVSLRTLRPDLPERFVNAVDRALDPDPVRRFGSAEEMRDALAEPPADLAAEATPPTLASRLADYATRVGLVLLALAGTTILSGFLGWRTFQLALHVDPIFAPPLSEYVRLGQEAMLPFLIYWAGGVLLIALLRGVDVVAGGPVTGFVRKRSEAMSAAAVTRIGAGACVIAMVAWSALLATYWAVFDTLVGLPLNTAGVSSGILDQQFWALNLMYGNFAAWLVFVLLGMALYVFPLLERQRPERSGLRPFVWTAIVISVLVICSAVLSRRLAFDRFEQVVYEERRAFVIASNGDQLLLYTPRRPELGTVRIRADDPRLLRMSRSGLLVES